jgi:hypothetical protein
MERYENMDFCTAMDESTELTEPEAQENGIIDGGDYGYNGGEDGEQDVQLDFGQEDAPGKAKRKSKVNNTKYYTARQFGVTHFYVNTCTITSNVADQ